MRAMSDDKEAAKLGAAPLSASEVSTAFGTSAGSFSGGGDVALFNIDALLSWSQRHSLWPLSFGLACCAIEMMATYASHHDLDRLGVIPRATPRQADLLIVSGTVTFKMAARIQLLYAQMPTPKYVISMGSCANCGGPYWQHGYHVVKGVDRIIPVDIYVPGCPPRPEALIGGILELQEKMKKEKQKRKFTRP